MTEDHSGNGALKMLIIGLVVGLALGGGLSYLYLINQDKSNGNIATQASLSKDEVSLRIENFLTNNLLNPGMTTRVENVTPRQGLYELYDLDVIISAGGQEQSFPGVVTKDGDLFFPNVIDLTQPLPQADEGPQVQESEISMEGLIDDDPSFGPQDAKVVIVEFSDFQCPFCAKVAPTVKRIKESYGDKVLFVFRDFPIASIHPLAEKAAQSAQCAHDQGMFWEFHDLLFEGQKEWSSGGSVDSFKAITRELGLDSTTFNECLDSGKYEGEVKKDLQEGQHFGVTGTPTFFINGQKLVGARSYEEFTNIIDAELG